MQDNELWRQLAESKWGPTAVSLSAENGIAGPDTWFAFCQHRMCVKEHRYSLLLVICTARLEHCLDSARRIEEF